MKAQFKNVFVVLAFVCLFPATALADVLAEIKTSKGTMTAELYAREVPLTVFHFVGLAEGKLNQTVRKGKPFYDGLQFYSVVPQLMVQTGCPDNKGNQSVQYTLKEDTEAKQKVGHHIPGTLSMALNRKGEMGSRFAITFGKLPFLDQDRIAFGKIIQGLEVLSTLELGDKIETIKIIKSGEDEEVFKISKKKLFKFKEQARKNNLRVIRKQAADEYRMIQKRWPKNQQFTRGIRFQIQKTGYDKRHPQEGDEVSILYKGSLLDDTIFDEQLDSRAPFKFRIGKGRVISGLNLMVKDMILGEKRVAIFSSKYAFGQAGLGSEVKPDQTVVYEIELLNIANKVEKK